MDGWVGAGPHLGGARRKGAMNWRGSDEVRRGSVEGGSADSRSGGGIARVCGRCAEGISGCGRRALRCDDAMRLRGTECCEANIA